RCAFPLDRARDARSARLLALAAQPRLVRGTGLLAIAAALVACGGSADRSASIVPLAPFWPARAATAAPVRVLVRTPLAPGAPGARGAPGAHGYEYVSPDRHIDVYTVGSRPRLVASWLVPEAHGYRGVAVSPRTEMLYLSVGGNGGSSGRGSLIAYSLRGNRV